MGVEIEGIVYLSTDDVTRELGISRQTLWRWRQEGKVPPGSRFRDGRLLFSEGEVDQIRAYAHHLEPAEVKDDGQLRLFNGSAPSLRKTAKGNGRG